MHGLILIFCLKFSYCSKFIFSISSDEALSQMAIADNDEVFVAGENLIYKLSANLSQLMNVSVSSDSSVRVRGLSVSNGGELV